MYDNFDFSITFEKYFNWVSLVHSLTELIAIARSNSPKLFVEKLLQDTVFTLPLSWGNLDVYVLTKLQTKPKIEKKKYLNHGIFLLIQLQ